MNHEYPEAWTEDHFRNLPDEDNRYEWKGYGRLSDDSLFRNKLSKELGAFANSYGGTLFLGIADDGLITGVPIIFKGRQTTKEWLENLIPALFELRLQSFRVTTVTLSPVTQADVGDDKAVLAVDVDDSPLAPHQSVGKIYYYRVSGNSVPAPHHYLTYLWGRTNPNQGSVVRLWCLNFLNPAIEILNLLHGDLQFRKLPNGQVQHLEKWTANMQTLTADQVLRTFPEIEREFNRITSQLVDIERMFESLRQSIRETLKRLSDMGILTNDGGVSDRIEQMEKWQAYLMKLLKRWGIAQSLSPEGLEVELVGELAHLLIGVVPNEARKWHFDMNRDFTYPVGKIVRSDQVLMSEADNVKTKLEGLVNDLSTYAHAFKDFRYQLCVRHATTYA